MHFLLQLRNWEYLLAYQNWQNCKNTNKKWKEKQTNESKVEKRILLFGGLLLKPLFSQKVFRTSASVQMRM